MNCIDQFLYKVLFLPEEVQYDFLTQQTTLILGESILFCREAEKIKVEQLIGSDLEPVSSCLIQGNGETLCSSMKRAILEVR